MSIERAVIAAVLVFAEVMTTHAAEQVDCTQVRIEQVAPLDFGLLRPRRGAGGWVLVDAAGGSAYSPGLAQSAARPPSPGLLRVSAPGDTELLLSVTPSSGWLDLQQRQVRTFAVPVPRLRRGSQPLTQEGQSWRVSVPPMRRGERLGRSELLLSVGGELSFEHVDRAWELTASLEARCVSIRAGA